MNMFLVHTVMRQLMTMAGSVIVAGGYASGDQWTAVTGGVIAGVSVIWGLFNAKKQEGFIKAAPAPAPVPAKK